MTPETLLHLRSLIGHALRDHDEPDPHLLASTLAPKLPHALLIEIARDRLGDVAREMIRSDRRTEIGRAGPSRWAYLHHARVAVNGTWMMLRDCTRDNLLWLADDYAQQAEQLHARASFMRQLADELHQSGRTTVGELYTNLAAAA